MKERYEYLEAGTPPIRARLTWESTLYLYGTHCCLHWQYFTVPLIELTHLSPILFS